MNKVVADTDVLSYIFKNHPFGSRYDAEVVDRIPLISFMTVAEIERWVLQYRVGEPADCDAAHLPAAVYGGAVKSGPLPSVGPDDGGGTVRRPQD